MDQHEQQHPDRQHVAAEPAPAEPAPAAHPPVRRSRRRRTAVAVATSGALSAALVLGGTALAVGLPGTTATGTVASRAGSSGTDTGAWQGWSGSSGLGDGSWSPGASGSSGSTAPRGPSAGGGSATPATGTSGTAALDVTSATAGQQAGVVLIRTVLGYQSAEAAGTGVVLTSDGLVVTNNHVVEGSTLIRVTVAATGQTYTATVVGTDATADVAVLQLQQASGLTTAALDDDGTLAVGDGVTAVGNAEGGGTLLAAAGTVTGLDASVTTQAEGASAGESLTGMIRVDADVVSGDSGGPLLDDEGEVVGITTAASSGSADITGFAIPVDDVLGVVSQIVAGHDTDTITLGYPAFLGVQLTQGTAATRGASLGAGATVGGVVDGTPAAQAGLAAGDTVTAVDGTPVTSADALASVLAQHAPGDTVALTWTTAAGVARSASVTLVAGPAD